MIIKYTEMEEEKEDLDNDETTRTSIMKRRKRTSIMKRRRRRMPVIKRRRTSIVKGRRTEVKGMTEPLEAVMALPSGMKV